MKLNTLTGVAILVGAWLVSPMTMTVQAQGMPAEARANIHTLFDNHSKIRRTVERTEKGYVAVTESDDPHLVAALREHVRQMNARLESGLMVRRWDPAFAEYVQHYNDIQHRFTKTRKGLRMTVTGKTPEAVRVVQNHASVISEFLADGWKAHDRIHPAVTTKVEATAKGSECCLGGAKSPCCGKACGTASPSQSGGVKK